MVACDVVLDEDGGVKIDSYINNLHPVKHAKLYPLIKRFIQISLPAWDMVYRWPTEFCIQRLSVGEARKICKVPGI